MSLADPPKLEDVAKLEDIEMPDVKPKHEEEPQADEEMDDLFGNDDDLDEPKPASDALPQMPQRCVQYYISSLVLMLIFQPRILRGCRPREAELRRARGGGGHRGGAGYRGECASARAPSTM